MHARIIAITGSPGDQLFHVNYKNAPSGIMQLRINQIVTDGGAIDQQLVTAALIGRGGELILRQQGFSSVYILKLDAVEVEQAPVKPVKPSKRRD